MLALLRAEAWLAKARPEQVPPDGTWRVWYLRGGRGAGKTRTGSETLASWIDENPPTADAGGEWAIVAPTYGDARSVCAEGPSGLIKAFAGVGAGVRNWNRSEGTITTGNGSLVYLDGANDGALRIQGKNLRGVWADEVGLWELGHWDTAWNTSIRFAVRQAPGRIVATGTPKMGHPLVGHLLASDAAAVTHMRTTDNAANLDPASLADLIAEYGGTTLGRQELEGEYIEALEGSILHRHDWRWYPVEGSFYGRGSVLARPYEQIIHSWDTALKDKTSSDFVAGQVWGITGPDRYLLRVWHGHASLNATVAAMRELRGWALELWPRQPHRILVENTANGPDAIAQMRREVDGVYPVTVKGDKVQRVLAASPALETGHCWLPGFPDPNPGGKGYGVGTPADVQAFVEEAAMFRGDMKHAHDDQVDAWSQMVNWTRSRSGQRPGRIGGTTAIMPEPGSMVVR